MIRNLANLDRTVFQPLGRIIQEAFADGFVGTGSITITRAYTTSSGFNKGLYLTGSLDGGGGSAYGMFKFRTYVNSALSADAHTLCANLHFKDDAELPAQGNPEYASAPLYVSCETEITSVAPDLSNGNLAAIYVGYYVNEGVGAPANAYVMHFNCSAEANMGKWDGLLNVQNPGDIGDVVNSSTPTWATPHRRIPIKVGPTTYYIHASID